MDVGDSGELIRFDHVCKSFNDRERRRVVAVEDVSFSIRRGQFFSIMGPSGCGKTTVLRLAAGLDVPSSGDVLFNGVSVSSPGKERGLVFQAYNSFPWLTVRQNVSFGLKKPVESADKIDSWLSITGLADFADAFPKQLSGGMRQRLAIARAMIVEPKLLLLDEPFGALDEGTRESMQAMLLNAAGRIGCSVVMVTHDMREAVLLSDQIVVLSSRPGKVVRVVNCSSPKPRNRALLGTSDYEVLYSLLRNGGHE